VRVCVDDSHVAVLWIRQRGARVERFLTDNGTGYRPHVFTVATRAQRLVHRQARPDTPRTDGKAERFIRTLLRVWAYGAAFLSSAHRTPALGRWLRYYSWHCRHRGLSGTPPISSGLAPGLGDTWAKFPVPRVRAAARMPGN
jgi:transposase InsO family protein